MKPIFRYLFPLVGLFLLVGVIRTLEAATTLSGLVTLPSPTFVMPGTILSGQALRLGESIPNGTDPSTVNTFQRPVGSWITSRDGSIAWVKSSTFAGSGWERLRQGSQVSGNSYGYILTRAQSLTSINPVGGAAGVLTCFRDDFVLPPSATTYTLGIAGSATNAVDSTAIGGKQLLSTGVTAGSQLNLLTQGSVTGRPDTQRFYWGARYAMTTAVDNVTIAVGGFEQGLTQVISIGVCGATSTTTFQLAYDTAGACTGGSRLTTGQPVDTNTHLWELWGVGDTKLHAAVDQIEIVGSPVTMAASPTVSIRPSVQVLNGATAANRAMDVDWWQVCWGES